MRPESELKHVSPVQRQDLGLSLSDDVSIRAKLGNYLIPLSPVSHSLARPSSTCRLGTISAGQACLCLLGGRTSVQWFPRTWAQWDIV